VKAVVFDLWETLVPMFPADEGEKAYAAMAARLGAEEPAFVALWRARREFRETRPLADAMRSLCEELSLDAAGVEGAIAVRREFTRAALVARPGALDVLRELRARGKRLGLITVCTEDVEELWPETPMAELVDAAVFSCSAGMNKPDPRIYALASERLGVDPSDCLYVGDGRNDELRGAERAGMRAVQLRLPEHGPRAWDGAYVESLEQVRELV
jgi:putative hydrolase of the HAD superfamily